jgi:DNA adenine methylase
MIKPFLKWAGGKRWLARRITPLFDASKKSRYIEPFLGSGAVFFATQPKRALLADSNDDLVLTFRAVRDHPEYLVDSLSEMKISKGIFNKIRVWKPSSPLDRATRFLYLNRTAFNGLFRVNSQGEFNVPYGCKKGTTICDAILIQTASKALQNSTFFALDFRKTLDKARSSDFIYVDPPYTVKHDNNGFRRYNEKIFSWEDQQDLADNMNLLAKSGAAIVVSNAAHCDIAKLYSRRMFVCCRVRRPSLIASTTESRGVCSEFLFISRSILDLKTNLIETGGLDALVWS